MERSFEGESESSLETVGSVIERSEMVEQSLDRTIRGGISWPLQEAIISPDGSRLSLLATLFDHEKEIARAIAAMNMPSTTPLIPCCPCELHSRTRQGRPISYNPLNSAWMCPSPPLPHRGHPLHPPWRTKKNPKIPLLEAQNLDSKPLMKCSSSIPCKLRDGPS